MPPHPHQRQNDKACHRRGFDQLQHRSKQHICRVPRLCGHSQHDAYGHAQPKTQQNAPGAETHPLPELCLRQKLQKSAHRLHRRNKEHLLSHRHGGALPHRQPEGRSAQPLKKLFMLVHGSFLLLTV